MPLYPAGIRAARMERFWSIAVASRRSQWQKPEARKRPEQANFVATVFDTQMAELLGLSDDTVRNHVKRLLQRLNARSRVEAVAKARLAGLI